MRIIHCIPDLHPESGGPPRIVAGLADACVRHGCSTEIVTQSIDGNQRLLRPSSDGVRLTVVPCPGGLRARYKTAPGYAEQVADLCEDKERPIIHLHGLWLPNHHTVTKLAARRRVPIVVSLHGMLSPWAIRFRGWKKWVAWSIFQRRDLCAAGALHVTSEAEAGHVRRLGLRVPVALIRTGVDIPGELPRRAPGHGDRTVLFLSRLHPVKGLLDLVSAWSKVRPKGWSVVVAGNDEGNHRAEVERAVERAGLANVFRFVGPVDDGGKWKLYARADLFVLPSRSENFGFVVAEALGSGLPVITTTGTPWSELKSFKCGWWIDIGAEALAQALREATVLSSSELSAMGARGRRLVESNYSWAQMEEKMTRLYSSLLSGRAEALSFRVN